ncbi:hypothetical protein [Stenotrophomonas phage CM2]
MMSGVLAVDAFQVVLAQEQRADSAEMRSGFGNVAAKTVLPMPDRPCVRTLMPPSAVCLLAVVNPIASRVLRLDRDSVAGSPCGSQSVSSGLTSVTNNGKRGLSPKHQPGKVLRLPIRPTIPGDCSSSIRVPCGSVIPVPSILPRLP